PNNIDVVLVDLHEISGLTPDYLNHLVENIQQCCKAPVLFNDSSMEHFAGGTDLGRKLSIKLGAIAGRA
ncbi:MAG: hypothetical protein OEY27_02465, partial [Gammaproteobacteria bacterium]|nr:hypothetical protein [Gammaproteobacteria bacterium]